MKENLISQFINRNGLSQEKAEELAALNVTLVEKMKQGIVKFYFQKVDGTLREAYGTLREDLLPIMSGDQSRRSDTTQPFYDTEKMAWRSYKVANLVSIA